LKYHITLIINGSQNRGVQNTVMQIVINRDQCSCRHSLNIENRKKLRITKDAESALIVRLKHTVHPLLRRHRRINHIASLTTGKIALTTVII